MVAIDMLYLSRDEGQQFAHMGIGAMDIAALRSALTPFVEEGAPQELVLLALKAVSPAADKRPTMEAAMHTLSGLAAAIKCPDYLDLHADMEAVAALEVWLFVKNQIVVTALLVQT